MTDQLSGAPPYTVAGVKFECWITGITKLPGTASYEWRGASNRLRVGKAPGCRVKYRPDGSKDIQVDYWATCDGRAVRGHHSTLGSAMAAAIGTAASLKRAA